MKKYLALIVAMVMMVSLVACGSSTPAAPSGPAFSPEQQAVYNEYNDLVERYDAIVDRINGQPMLLEDEEFVENMNYISTTLIETNSLFETPEVLTPEVISGLELIFATVDEFIVSTTPELDVMEQGEGYEPVTEITLPVVITNGTGMDIHTLKLSPENDNNWGENLISEPIAKNAQVEAELLITSDTIVWDILIADKSGTEYTFMGVDFSEVDVSGATMFLEATEGGDYFASVA